MDLLVTGLFWFLAALALASGIAVVALRSPVGSVFSLIVNSAALAGLYLLLGDYFLAAIQVVVYSGAILVLFLFVVMLLDLRRDELAGAGGRVRRAAVALLAGGLAVMLGMSLGWGIGGSPRGMRGEEWGIWSELAEVLFGRYVLAFEAVSILLVAAMVGVVVLTKKGYVPDAAFEDEGTAEGSP